MSALTTDSFIAERQPNGDVWITNRTRNIGGKTRTPLAPEESEPIIIPQEKREALAKLLWPDMELTEEEWIPNYNRPPYKVDYAHRTGEPE